MSDGCAKFTFDIKWKWLAFVTNHMILIMYLILHGTHFNAIKSCDSIQNTVMYHNVVDNLSSEVRAHVYVATCKLMICKIYIFPRFLFVCVQIMLEERYCKACPHPSSHHFSPVYLFIQRQQQ